MIDLSFAGLVGAFIGTVLAAFAYGPLVSSVERLLQAGSQPIAESNVATRQQTMQSELSLLRRSVLAADIIAFAGLGYWLGAMIGI